MSAIDDLMGHLDRLTASDFGAFPYAGCRWLQTARLDRHEALIPDLDVYLSEFAGYRSWGNKIQEWSAQTLASVEQRLNQSFFDRFPAHASLQPLLASPEAADVRRTLDTADQTRMVLARLLSAIRNARSGAGQ